MHIMRQSDPSSENLDNEDDASILLSMCTSAPHLDVSIRCKIDAELEDKYAVISWKEDADQEDSADDEEEEGQHECDDGYGSSDGSGSWLTETDDESGSNEEGVSSGTDADDSKDDSKSQSSIDDGSNASSARSVEELWDAYFNDPDDRPQYLFEVDRDRVLESSLNSLQNMSKWAPNAFYQLCACVWKCFRYDASCELSVEFKDEQGIDGGGLTKTFLTEVSTDTACVGKGRAWGRNFASGVF